MTAGSDDCTICLPVDCEGQEWHMTRVGLNGALTSQNVGTKPPGEEVLVLVGKTRVSQDHER